MMTKVIPPGSWDFGEAATQMIKVSSSGLVGYDLNTLIKKAGHELADKVKNMEFGSGEVPVFQIAMGSTESYGCFVAGSKVRMANGSIKNIEEVHLGEKVVNRLGRPDEVITSYQRPYEGVGIRLDVAGLLDTITCTDKHKFYIITKEQVACSIVIFDPVWTGADQLRLGDLVLSPTTEEELSVEPLHPKHHTFSWNGFICRPVRGIEQLELNESVYNLETKDDHSYTIESVTVKNCNRNGDGFRSEMLRSHHPSFVKHARAYRNHTNKDTKKSYGVIKLSHFNEDMKRVELIVALNGTKEAAEKNGGLVADKELEKLASGNDYDTSMALTVQFDKCSFCGNKARTRKEYCDDYESGGMCKGGGLKNNNGIVLKSGHQLHADNPNGRFFDISSVYRHADRISNCLGKVASGQIMGGAELAEFMKVSAPLYLLDDTDYPSDILTQIKIAHMLAQKETSYTPAQYDTIFNKSLDGLSEFSNHKAEVLKALSLEKIALSLSDWLLLVTNSTEEKVASVVNDIANCIPTVFTDLVNDSTLPDQLHDQCKSASTTHKIHNWARSQSKDHSFSKQAVQHRLWQATIQNAEKPQLRKTASARTEISQKLAKAYGIYQIGFLQDLGSDEDLDLISDLIIRQNKVS